MAFQSTWPWRSALPMRASAWARERQRKARAELDDRLPGDIGVIRKKASGQTICYAAKQVPIRPRVFSRGGSHA